jgi:hypothetical protein
MKRGRGRPPVYKNATDQPALVALRIPRALEARLRHESTEQGRTMTDILLQSLAAQWEHPTAAAELVEAQAQLETLKRQCAAQERKYAAREQRSTRLTQQRRTQAAADKKERTRLTEALATAEAYARQMHERVVVFTAANPELAEENARRYVNVQQEARHRQLEELREHLDHTLNGHTGRGQALPVSVRELQIQFHPDKWSNGQTAAEALTELMKVLNVSQKSRP